MINRYFVTSRESSADLGKDILKIERLVPRCAIALEDLPVTNCGQLGSLSPSIAIAIHTHRYVLRHDQRSETNE